jgi:DNA-binding LytR/AlgR family response regulator
MVDRGLAGDAATDGRRLRVFVVDDERLARERLIRLLRAVGGVEIVGEASNGADAIDEVARQRPEVVFLDVHMPGMDGFEVARRLGEPRPEVVFATAHDHQSLHAGEHLLKPFGRRQLTAVLARLRQRLSARPAPAVA